jgi:hypothetical protein
MLHFETLSVVKYDAFRSEILVTPGGRQSAALKHPPNNCVSSSPVVYSMYYTAEYTVTQQTNLILL